MRLGDFLRNKIRNFLHIEPAANHQIVLQQRLDFYGNIARNKLWYRGDSWELSDFYGQLDVSPTLFWKASSTKGMEIHKLHTGIPKLIIKTISNIILHDYNGLEITEPTAAEQWEKIEIYTGKRIVELGKQIPGTPVCEVAVAVPSAPLLKPLTFFKAIFLKSSESA